MSKEKISIFPIKEEIDSLVNPGPTETVEFSRAFEENLVVEGVISEIRESKERFEDNLRELDGKAWSDSVSETRETFKQEFRRTKDQKKRDELILEAVGFAAYVLEKIYRIELWDNQLSFIVSAILDADSPTLENFDFNRGESRVLQLPTGEGKTFCGAIISVISSWKTDKAVIIGLRDDTAVRSFCQETGEFIKKITGEELEGIWQRPSPKNEPISWTWNWQKSEFTEEKGFQARKETYSSAREKHSLLLGAKMAFVLDKVHDAPLLPEEEKYRVLDPDEAILVAYEIDDVCRRLTPAAIAKRIGEKETTEIRDELLNKFDFEFLLPGFDKYDKKYRLEFLTEMVIKKIIFGLREQNQPHNPKAWDLISEYFFEIAKRWREKKEEPNLKKKVDDWLDEHLGLFMPMLILANLRPGIDFLERLANRSNSLLLDPHDGMPHPANVYEGLVGLYDYLLAENPEWHLTETYNQMLPISFILQYPVIGMTATALGFSHLFHNLGMPVLCFSSHTSECYLRRMVKEAKRVKLPLYENPTDYFLSDNRKVSLKAIEEAVNSAEEDTPFLVICDTSEEAKEIGARLQEKRTVNYMTAKEEYYKPGQTESVARKLKKEEVLIATRIASREMNVPLEGLEVIVYSSSLELDILKQSLSRTIRGRRRSGGRLIIFERDKVLKQIITELTALIPPPFILALDQKRVKRDFKRKIREEVKKAWREEILWQTLGSKETNGKFFQIMEKYFTLQIESQSRQLLFVLLSEQKLAQLQNEFFQDIDLEGMPDSLKKSLSLFLLLGWENFSDIYKQSFNTFIIDESLKGKGDDLRYLWETWMARAKEYIWSS